MWVILDENLQGNSCPCLRHEGYVGRGIAPVVVNLGKKCRWETNVTPRPLYPQGKDSGVNR